MTIATSIEQQRQRVLRTTASAWGLAEPRAPVWARRASSVRAAAHPLRVVATAPWCFAISY